MFAYCFNDPLNFSDYTGMVAIPNTIHEYRTWARKGKKWGIYFGLTYKLHNLDKGQRPFINVKELVVKFIQRKKVDARNLKIYCKIIGVHRKGKNGETVSGYLTYELVKNYSKFKVNKRYEIAINSSYYFSSPTTNGTIWASVEIYKKKTRLWVKYEAMFNWYMGPISPEAY